MAPKQQNNKAPKQQKQSAAAEQNAAVSAVTTEDVLSAPFLKKEVRLELTDGRVVVGTVVSFLGCGDLVLTEVTEFRQFTAEDNHGVAETCIRQLSLMAVPFPSILAMHERKPGNVPVMEVVTEKLQQQMLLKESKIA